MRLPDPLFARAFLRRAAFIWLGGRLLLLLAFALAASGGQAGDDQPVPLALGPLAIVLVIIVVALVGWIEARRRNEHLFLANLGVPSRAVALISALPALVGEVLVALLLPDSA